MVWTFFCWVFSINLHVFITYSRVFVNLKLIFFLHEAVTWSSSWSRWQLIGCHMIRLWIQMAPDWLVHIPPECTFRFTLPWNSAVMAGCSFASINIDATLKKNNSNIFFYSNYCNYAFNVGSVWKWHILYYNMLQAFSSNKRPFCI